MSQVTIYLDDESEALAKRAAKAANVPVSRWISTLIKQAAANQWPPGVLALAGSWADSSFPSAEALRKKAPKDIKRIEL